MHDSYSVISWLHICYFTKLTLEYTVVGIKHRKQVGTFCTSLAVHMPYTRCIMFSCVVVCEKHTYNYCIFHAC